MWIMTPFGILMPSAIPADAGISGEWDLQVRSREQRALKHFRKRYMTAGTSSQVVSTPRLDYEYRFYTRRDAFSDGIAEMIADIDYDKFKPTTMRKGMGGEQLHSVYNEMWYSYFRSYSPKYLRPANPTSKPQWWEDR